MEDININGGKIRGVNTITGNIGAGTLIVNDYRISTESIDNGYRLIVEKHGEIQTLDISNGVGINKIEKIGSTGDVDNYRITLSDGTTFDYEIETNEASRSAAELQRVEAEAARSLAEEIRSMTEADRQFAENTREESEKNRIEAELTRSESETERDNAESERSTHETERIENEAMRVNAENDREVAEDARVEAENSRVSVEAERVSAESGRVNAEDARVASEAGRESAETERVSAESAREQAEDGRKNAEASRATAEQNRASAESVRVAAEAERANAENERANAESARMSAEQERVAAESDRVNAETERAETFTGYETEIDQFKTELVTSKDAATENTRFAIGEAEESLEVPSMEEFNGLKGDLSDKRNNNRFIASVEISELVNAIYVNGDTNGNAFDLSEVVIIGVAPVSANTDALNGYISIGADGITGHTGMFGSINLKSREGETCWICNIIANPDAPAYAEIASAVRPVTASLVNKQVSFGNGVSIVSNITKIAVYANGKIEPGTKVYVFGVDRI